MAPEAVAFAAIGLGNLVLFFLIFNVLIFIGAVKATVIATLVTTYLAYLANRHWTYKDRPRRAVRREYTLFFGVNMVGLLIQSTGNGLLKYGLGMSEGRDRLAFNLASTVCICIATVFRFWTYRTVVFKDAPVMAEVDVPATETTADAAPTAEAALTAEAAVVAAENRVPARREPEPAPELEIEFEELAASLELETDKPAEGARTH